MKITREALDQVNAHASEGYPHEVCGILIRGDGAGVVTEARRVRNIMEKEELARDPGLVSFIREVFPALSNLDDERARDRYLMDPRDQMRIQRECDDAGLQIIGYYHSHPDHPARASITDAERSWAGSVYLIVSCEKGEVVDGNAFVADQDRGPMRPEPLEVV
jgi:proteasome lid subunit RPN8/RPN11